MLNLNFTLTHRQVLEVKGRLGALTPVFDESAMQLHPQYQLEVGGEEINLNDQLGAGVVLRWLGEIACTNCSEAVPKLYGGGYCYDCFSTLARADLCLVSPDRCHFHQGTCREPDWGEAFCMQPHVVYLANTSGPKIGITRLQRTRRRWLDQGAGSARVVAHMPTRRAAGWVEAYFKGRMQDRTDWRRLVSGRLQSGNLASLASVLREELPVFDGISDGVLSAEEHQSMAWVDAAEEVQIEYPRLAYSPAVRLPLSAGATSVKDNLQGVIGRYLLFTQGVVNLGDYNGMGLEIEFAAPYAAAELNTSDQMSLFD